MNKNVTFCGSAASRPAVLSPYALDAKKILITKEDVT